MKKIVLSFVVVLSLCLSLVGCSYVPVESSNNSAPILADSLFERVSADVGVTIFDSNDVVLYRDTLTDVMYIAYRGKHETSLCVMVNSDGTPLLYSEWRALRETSE